MSDQARCPTYGLNVAVITGSDGSFQERVAALESWLDKRTLAHLGYSVRSVERLIVDGMPHFVMLGRVRARHSR